MGKNKKMKQKNQNTGGLIGRCFLAGAFALGGTGCEITPAQEGAIGGAMLQNIAATDSSLTYNQSQSLGALGGLLGSLAHQEAMKEAAREGRSEININVNGQRVRTTQARTQSYGSALLPEHDQRKIISTLYEGWQGFAVNKIRQIFTFNNYCDFNGNGKITFDEFIGVKRNFRKNEPIQIGFQMVNYNVPFINFIKKDKGKLTKLSAIISNGKEERVFENNFDLNSIFIKFKLPENLNQGIYKIRVECTDKKGRQEYKEQIFQILE